MRPLIAVLGRYARLAAKALSRNRRRLRKNPHEAVNDAVAQAIRARYETADDIGSER